MKTALTLTIDCRRADTVLKVHKEIARQLQFPKHYGHNVDALRDCLGDVLLEYTIVLQWIDTRDSRTDRDLQAIKRTVRSMIKN